MSKKRPIAPTVPGGPLRPKYNNDQRQRFERSTDQTTVRPFSAERSDPDQFDLRCA